MRPDESAPDQPLSLIEVPADVLGCTPETAAQVRAMVRTWPRLGERTKDRLAALLALHRDHREKSQSP